MVQWSPRRGRTFALSVADLFSFAVCSGFVLMVWNVLT